MPSSAQVAACRQVQIGRPSASGSGLHLVHGVAVRGDPEQAFAPDHRRAGPGVSTWVMMARSRSAEAIRSTSIGVGSHTTVTSTRGIGVREPRQDLGQVAVGIIVGHAEPDPSREFRIGEARPAPRSRGARSPRIVEQPLAVLGQPGGAAVPLEDRPADASPRASSSASRRPIASCARLSAARVNEPASAMAMKVFNWSMSRREAMQISRRSQ